MFEDVLDLGCDKVVQLGGFNKKTKTENPTVAEGHYVGSRDIPSKFSKSGFAKLHVLQTSEGSLGVFGKTDLDPKMAVVEPGVLVRITQTHSVPTNKGNDLLKFKVQVDKENRIDISNVSSMQAADTTEGEDVRYDGGEVEETPLEAEETAADEVVPTRAQAPSRPASAPSASRVAQVNALLKGRGTTTRTA